MLKGKILPVSEFSAADISVMYALMAEFYDDTDEQVFLRDFRDKDYCLALYHDTDGLVGFTTQKVMSLDVDGRIVHGIFSGDTIIHKSHWGDMELFKVWARFWFDYAQRYDEFYWFLICKGYKTYRILPLFWTEFYPARGKETPDNMQRIIDAYAEKMYPNEYDKTDGVIKYDHVKDKLKAGVADVGEHEMKNKDIAFFCEKNPSHVCGNDLACIAKIDKSALKKRAVELLFNEREM